MDRRIVNQGLLSPTGLKKNTKFRVTSNGDLLHGMEVVSHEFNAWHTFHFKDLNIKKNAFSFLQ